MKQRCLLAVSCALVTAHMIAADERKAVAGSSAEPVRYVGTAKVNMAAHDGGFRPAVGVKNYQVFRANRKHPEQAEGLGWTYNHQPMLAYWRGHFYLEFLSNPYDEHRPPGRSLLITSADGVHWDFPREVFPRYKLPNGNPALMHQRMGFYVAPNGRLLVSGFYGVPPSPNDGRGIGRVVREIHEDGSFGPIYFIRYDAQNGWGPKNTSFPFYTASPDAGFTEACRALLANKLMTLQWWEEDRGTDGFFPESLKKFLPSGLDVKYRPGVPSQVEGGLKAFTFYHRADGKIVGLWKASHVALTSDNGKTWSEVVKVPSLVMNSAKVWGQRTTDGRYALVYNPTEDNKHRWPLAIITGDDGITFDKMLVVHGEVPLRRFTGLFKDLGPQYVRGVSEGNGTPPGNYLWVTYSVNKEDIWVSRIPVPVRGEVQGPVRDTFDAAGPGDRDWNLYCPKWAKTEVVDFPSRINRSLMLEDRDPYDYAKAVRVFPISRAVTLSFRILARQNDTGRLEIELLNRSGRRPVRLVFEDNGWIRAGDGDSLEPIARYDAGQWYDFRFSVDAEKRRYDVAIDGKTVLEQANFVEPVTSVERLSLRTGTFRTEPLATVPTLPGADLPGADDPVASAVYYLDDVNIQTVRPEESK